MRLVLLAAAFALAACQPAEPPAAPDAAPAAGAGETGQDEPGAPQAPGGVAMTPVTFEAMSKTAESFTGAITLTAVSPVGPNAAPTMILETANGQRYETELVPGGAAQASVVDWASVFNTAVDLSGEPASASPSVDIHVVNAETVPETAPNGGFCGKTKTFALAIAAPIEGAGGRYLGLAAFSGDQWPPKEATQLCGTFNYILP
jgi:hypothetical protein